MSGLHDPTRVQKLTSIRSRHYGSKVRKDGHHKQNHSYMPLIAYQVEDGYASNFVVSLNQGGSSIHLQRGATPQT